MNNFQTEKSSNKKNNQRAGNYQDNQSSQQKKSRNSGQETQSRGENKRQESSGGGGAKSLFPVSAISAAVTSQLVDNLGPRVLGEIKEQLIGQFGEEKVESWMVFFNGQEAGDQNAIYTLIRNAAPSLPEELSLSSLMDWAPIRSRVSKSPVAAAAAVAAGVGALYLTREMLKNGNFSVAGVNDAPKSRKAKLTAATQGGKTKLDSGANNSKKMSRA